MDKEDMLYNIEIISKIISEMELEMETTTPVEACNKEFYEYLKEFPNDKLKHMHESICANEYSNKALYERVWILLIEKEFIKLGITDELKNKFEYHRTQYNIAVDNLN